MGGGEVIKKSAEAIKREKEREKKLIKIEPAIGVFQLFIPSIVLSCDTAMTASTARGL